MSAMTNINVSKILAGFALAAITTISSWTCKRTNDNSHALGVLQQIVVDSKEARMTAQLENSKAHERIDKKLDIQGESIQKIEVDLARHPVTAMKP